MFIVKQSYDGWVLTNKQEVFHADLLKFFFGVDISTPLDMEYY